MTNLIPAIWTDLYIDSGCVPMFINGENIFFTLNKDGKVDKWPETKIKIFPEDVMVSVEVFRNGKKIDYDAILLSAQGSIRNSILKHMRQLYQSTRADFDGMFIGYERAFSVQATSKGYLFEATFCLGYTRRDPELGAFQEYLPITGCFPRVFDPTLDLS